MNKIVDEKQAWEIFEACPYYTISLIDEQNKPYAYMTSLVNIDGYLYAHGSLQGKKIDCMKYQSNVFISGCSELTYDEVKTTANYQSIHIEGEIEIVEDIKEKQKVLSKIIERYAKMKMEVKQVAHVGIYKIKL